MLAPKPADSDRLHALMTKMCESARGRMEFITWAAQGCPDNWQNVETPYDTCRKMVDLIPADATHYAVLFSMEFLEVLVKERGVDPLNVVFFADTEIESKMASDPRMYGVGSVILDKSKIITDEFNPSELARILTRGIRHYFDLEDDMETTKLAVVMNPPYQTEDGGSVGGRSAVPIYNHFIETIIDEVQPYYFVSINPSRWMVGGKGLDRFRQRMMVDKRIRSITHFQGAKDVFPSANIPGGVNYFLWDKNFEGSCSFNGVERDLDEFDVIIHDTKSIHILRKSLTSSTIARTCLSRNPFGLQSSFSNWVDDGVKCYKNGGKWDTCGTHSFTDRYQILHRWKVATSKAYMPGGDLDGTHVRVLCKPFVIQPGEVCTETYLIINHFDSEVEAENFVAYVKTKFFRFMTLLRKPTQNISKDCFNFVPDLQDYTKPWTDAELYDRFGLTEDERAYIESKIKPLS